MAKQIWNSPIDKHTDWGGDQSTNNCPVSGEMVQQFIKESFEKKAGLFYYDTTNNRYLVFADTEARDSFLDDPTKTDLILGTFDAPFNYSAEIVLTTPTYNAVFLGSAGNYIDFTYDIKNKQGTSTGENVTITYTFMRNGVKKEVKEVRKSGDAVHFNIDKYLAEGNNTVIVGITGQTTLAATTIALTYQVVNITISDEWDISRVVDMTEGRASIEVPFTVSGYGTKIIEWYFDNILLPFDKDVDEVVDVTASRIKHIGLANINSGRHSLQMRAYTLINGEKFYTDTLYRDLMVYTGKDTNPMAAIAMTIPAKHGLADTNNTILYGITQYIPYTLRFATYSPQGKAEVNTSIVLDGKEVGSLVSKNDIINEFTIISKELGTKILDLNFDEFTYRMSVNVGETTMNLQEITTNLLLDFSASGKTNNSTDRDNWEYGVYRGTFSGFNWNSTSGWVNNRLKMNAGTSFAINFAPLGGEPTATGKTIELEFKTINVTNDDAVICDLRNESGVGILITATKVSLTSSDGVVLETEFKSNEDVRVGFVINRSKGTTNKCLSFIYANGSIARGEKWAPADKYTSNKNILFNATDEAEVELKAIRIYDTALSSDQILNNYILYRDSVAEMIEVYDRNDVYEEGTTTFSPDKMMGRLPVMIVTGDIPTLENTSDKDTQIVVDVDYYNMQDTSKSFRMEGAAMRPQGTSSMGYPKKNFRIYTQKVDGTILYDADGKVVADKLYSFKDGAQPVNCWCLKADYAESSGSHNTGIARLWNEALMNAQIDGEYKLRTEAQKKALEAGYPYDVRTTIDGFPILLFYRANRNDDLIFIGKYNFNNDKSTESVFGFTGIPGFDNSRMQCWEILNNGNPLALFTSVDNFDEGWKEAFESRYPDTKEPNTADLKAFATWMSGINGDHERFATEKWEHMDVYKMAAYWCYLMRHAGADQFVKNAMLTSEDGEKFYFILYDNDTINGLINTGHLRIKPTDGRQTIDESGAYVFAGHDSVLWNMLEADEEFNQIVSIVDNALYSAGISYANTIKMFDEEQAGKWVERVFNQDSQYKYIGPYVDRGINNLFMLQGSRNLHRKWWLAERFSIYDAKFVSGSYKSQAVEIKCINGTPSGQRFTIEAGYPLDYGFGINNLPRESGVSLGIGESHTFMTTEVVNVGDPIRIYAAPHISSLDLSEMSARLAVINMANAYDEALGTQLKRLYIGSSYDKKNVEVSEISGLKLLTSLEELDISYMEGITSLDLSNQPFFRKLYAIGSGISSVRFAKGAPVEALGLPALRSLSLEQLPYLEAYNVVWDKANTLEVVVRACPNVSNDFSWAYEWYGTKGVQNNSISTFVMDLVDWKNVDPTQFIEFSKIKSQGGNLTLKGKVVLSYITLEQIDTIKAIYGENCFNPTNEFFITVPDTLFFSGPSEVLEGNTAQFEAIALSEKLGEITYSLSPTNKATITPEGLVTTIENGVAETITVYATHTNTDGVEVTKSLSLSIKARVYPTEDTTTIIGTANPSGDENKYTWETTTLDVNGEMTSEWSLSGDIAQYVRISESDYEGCVVQKIADVEFMATGTLTMTLKKVIDGSVVLVKSIILELFNEDIIATAATNPAFMIIMSKAGLASNSNYMTKEEAAVVTETDLKSGTSYTDSIFYKYRSYLPATSGNEINLTPLKYFTSLTSIPSALIPGDRYILTGIEFPETVTTINQLCSGSIQANCKIRVPAQVTSINSAFRHMEGITIEFEPRTQDLDVSYAFYSSAINGDITFPEGITTLGYQTLYSAEVLGNVFIPASVVSVEKMAFYDFNCMRLEFLPGEDTLSFVSESDIWKNANIQLLKLARPTTINASNMQDILVEKMEIAGLVEFKGYAVSSPTLKEVRFTSDEILTINPFAFYDCPLLEVFDAPDYGAAVFEIDPRELSDKISGSRYKFNGTQLSNTLVSSATFVFNGMTSEVEGQGVVTLTPSTNNIYFSEEDGSIIKQYLLPLQTVTKLVLPRILYINCKVTTNLAGATTFLLTYTDADTGETVTEEIEANQVYAKKIAVNHNLTCAPTFVSEAYNSPSYSTLVSYSQTAQIAIAMMYQEIMEVKIQGTDGSYYSTDEWTAGGYANTMANGVAIVGKAGGGFVIAKEDSADLLSFGPDARAEYTSCSSSSLALLDKRGVSNTAAIIEYGAANSKTYPAAEYCNNFTFPNGNTGYLPGAGELKMVYDNRSAIDAALALIGGTAFASATYVSSSKYNISKVWTLHMYYGTCSNQNVGPTYNVRAFTTLTPNTPE